MSPGPKNLTRTDATGPVAEPVERRDALDRSLERAAERVFLSPRVVDQGAYDDFSSGLQRLIREADTRARSLEATGEQLRKVTEQLRTLMRELQQRTDAANKALPALEAAVKNAASLLDRVGTGAATQAARQLRDEVVKAVEAEREAIIAASRESVSRAVRTVVEQEAERALNEAQARTAEAATNPTYTHQHRHFDPNELHARFDAARRELDTIVSDARARVEECVVALERRTEAVAEELAAQLSGLREDARLVVREASEQLQAQKQAARPAPPTPVATPAHSPDSPSQLGHEQARQVLIDLGERVEGAAFALDAIEQRAKEIIGGAHQATNALAAQAGQVQLLLAHVQQAGAWLAHVHAQTVNGRTAHHHHQPAAQHPST